MTTHAELSTRSLATLGELLSVRSAEYHDRALYTLLPDGEGEEIRLSYRELDRRARAIAAQIQALVGAGERALLLYPPGLEYICAFFGCVYAGVVAIPAYPPALNRPLTRLNAIAANAQAALILTSSQVRDTLDRRIANSPALASLHCLATDGVADSDAGAWRRPAGDSDTLAAIQYTSGSTAFPKGVMLTHGNLLANLALIERCFGATPDTCGVSWLPPYHDMGLIGGILQPLYAGCSTILMPPVAFLQQPIRWLKAISRYGGTISGGPNFAYDLCANRITAEQCVAAGIDLSSWQCAFNGAEPIRAATLERFTTAFAPFGFSSQAWLPCYGLAEATLLVAGAQPGERPIAHSFSADALLRHQAVPSGPGAGAQQRLVSCGAPVPEQRVAIVEPASGAPLAAGSVGEIWVAGPSVAQGYWQNPEASRETFNLRLEADPGHVFMRSGDLGFIDQGQLFVTGRIKDMLIIRGRNYYPQDLELTAERSHPALQAGCGAAFTIDGEDGGRLVIAYELERTARRAQPDAVAAAIREALAIEHDVHISTVVLVMPAGIPKTSSGKIQRHACRAAFLDGTLRTIATLTLGQEAAGPAEPEDQPSREALLLLPPDERRQALGALVLRHIARQLGADPTSLAPTVRLASLGLDSLMAVSIQHRVEHDLGLTLPMDVLLGDLTLGQIADVLLPQLDEVSSLSDPAGAGGADDRLSYGQRALWFLHHLDPTSAAYTIARAVRVRSEIRVDVLGRAVEALAQRHQALRMTFAAPAGDPLLRIAGAVQGALTVEDASDWSPERLDRRVSEAANQAFDLDQGPLFHVRLFTAAPADAVLLLVIHHSIADFWSISTLVRDLGMLYHGELHGHGAQLAPLEHAYGDYIRWHNALVEGPEGERQWQYWQRQLADAPTALSLPLDRPRPARQTFAGSAHAFELSGEVSRALRQLSAQEDATLYMTLLAAFKVLLYRYSGQTDLIVGSPISGRTRAVWSEVVGYFVNPLVLRSSLAGNPSFRELLRRVRRTAIEAFGHQDYPFALLAERLHPERDLSRSPLFQVMFTLQQAPAAGAADLSLFALDHVSANMTLGGLAMESFPIPPATSQFDLALMMVETPDGLAATLQYNTALFEQATILRMAGHFQQIIAALLASPEAGIAQLPLLAADERQAMFDALSAPAADTGEWRCMHHRFEAQARRSPQSIAIRFEDEQITYAELDERASRLGAHLRGLGIAPESRVAICMERSPALLVALLAILKAGGAYVPLDPAYPLDRLAWIIDDARPALLITEQGQAGRLPGYDGQVICLDGDWPQGERASDVSVAGQSHPDQLAYVIYTSGSTGRPKGVAVTHGSVVNFFAGMDQRITCTPEDRLLAVTSISFDISVLELFWTLGHGATVILAAEQAYSAAGPDQDRLAHKGMDFSLFYFSSQDERAADDRYRLLIEGAKFADERGFSAVWTPERHFHQFGGLYPNPSVISAALAMITSRVQIRAGSVVLPLHHPIRVAEEWSVVDNLSRGRVAVAFASGWHADDFVFAPQHYPGRKAVLLDSIQQVQRLWRGEGLEVVGGAEKPITVQLHPSPVQAELPIWLTAATSPETFAQAGAMGANVLTHLLGQTVDELAEKIRVYRQSRAEHGHDPAAGPVTLMLHTFIGSDLDTVRNIVRGPFTDYLSSSIGLVQNLLRSLQRPFDLASMAQADIDALLAFAFDRYFETSALFGTPASCQPLIRRLQAIGVDELACLIDFGVAPDLVLKHLDDLDQVRALFAPKRERASLASLAKTHGATMMQCTPSMMRMIALDREAAQAFGSIRTLLLGGEALPPALVATLQDLLPSQIINMYGPTETTIWSTTWTVPSQPTALSIGEPIADTELYILDDYLEPVPTGVPGALYIGGAGLARGYLNRPELTAERFIPHPFSRRPGRRLYRTGDCVRLRADQTIEFLGRTDHQVKIRGHRIEPGEIEHALVQHPAVREAVVIAYGDASDSQQLAAYVVGAQGAPIDVAELRADLRQRLPAAMIPATIMALETLPLTPNGKIDRRGLPAPHAPAAPAGPQVQPDTPMEHVIAAIWKEVLKVEFIGIHDNFFDIGGHSLLMAHVHNLLQDRLRREIPLVSLLEHPTISALSQHLEQKQPLAPSFQDSDSRANRQRNSMRQRRNTVSTRSNS